MSRTLQHPYWAQVDNPRLAQRRAPEPYVAPAPTPGRVLRPVDMDTIPLCELGGAPSPAPVVDAPVFDDRKAIRRQIAKQAPREAGKAPACEGRDSLHDPVPLRSDEPVRVLKAREPHKDVKARSMWKRPPHVKRRFSQAGGYGGTIHMRHHAESWKL